MDNYINECIIEIKYERTNIKNKKIIIGEF